MFFFPMEDVQKEKTLRSPTSMKFKEVQGGGNGDQQI